jgi:predicted RNA-binding protein with PUA-like domain
MKKILYTLLAGICMACSNNIAWKNISIEKINVFDKNFEIVMSFTTAEHIAGIKNILAKSHETDYQGKINWDYTFDIVSETQTSRWLYASELGLFKLLTKQVCPIYQVENYEGLHQILRIKE